MCSVWSIQSQDEVTTGVRAMTSDPNTAKQVQLPRRRDTRITHLSIVRPTGTPLLRRGPQISPRVSIVTGSSTTRTIQKGLE